MRPDPSVTLRPSMVGCAGRGLLHALAVGGLCVALSACDGGDPGAGGNDGSTDGGGLDGGSDGASPDGGSGDGGGDGGDSTACTEVDAFQPVYTRVVETWLAQDELSAGPADPLVFVGSSSIRRWEGLALAYADHGPRQRGFGGAQLGEVAVWTDALVNRHEPRGVVVFAGTNDVAFGVSPDVVVERFRCFRQRVAQGSGVDTPILFIGITPTPSRWDQWEQASAVNSAVQALVADDPAVTYVDVPAAFLATGSPPDDSLFVDDGLHLSEEGYALWDGVLRPAVEAAVAADSTGGGDALAPGTRLLIDLGPDNPDDGEHAASPDHLGQHWNNWHPLDGGVAVLPGEHLDGLVTTTGAATGIDLVVTGGFTGNGRSNGGLLWPDGDLLGDLAVGSATGDYFYASGDDQTGGLWLRGLDPDQRYDLAVFAAREDPERRVTTYVVHGASTASASLQTSGAGAGVTADTNDDTVARLADLQPDAWGNLFIDVQQTEGSYAYIALLELVAR